MHVGIRKKQAGAADITCLTVKADDVSLTRGGGSQTWPGHPPAWKIKPGKEVAVDSSYTSCSLHGQDGLYMYVFPGNNFIN